MDLYKKRRSKFWVIVALLIVPIGLVAAAIADIVCGTMPHWR